jgi:hypothetical protein
MSKNLGKFDYDLLSLLIVDDVQEKAQYHAACITNYLLKWKKEHSADNYFTIKNESEHDIAFKKFLDILHHDLFENKKAFTMSSLLDKLCSLLPAFNMKIIFINQPRKEGHKRRRNEL